MPFLDFVPDDPGCDAFRQQQGGLTPGGQFLDFEPDSAIPVVASHPEEVPTCPICGEKFATSAGRTTHMRGAHKRRMAGLAETMEDFVVADPDDEGSDKDTITVADT